MTRCIRVEDLHDLASVAERHYFEGLPTSATENRDQYPEQDANHADGDQEFDERKRRFATETLPLNPLTGFTLA